MISIPDESIRVTMQGVIDNFLKPKFISLGMNATGKWLNALTAEASNGIGYIKGLDYTYYLANGRAGGSMPPIAPLQTWVGAKFGIYGNEGRSIAFAVAKKIQREGTDHYPEGTDLLDVLNSREVLDYIYGNLNGFLRVQIELEIKRMARNTLILA
jgi:hypothetical protein